MMNYQLPFLPQRSEKDRNSGITMVMDKGLSVRQAEDLCDVSAHLIDFVKLGFGTSSITNKLKEKIKVYQQHNIKVYLGGTLFEAFLIRNMVDDYRQLVKDLGVDAVEISDGSMEINHNEKCDYIRSFSQDYTVLSEVGSKDANVHLADEIWLEEMDKELKAGAFKVIAEARESGTVGIFDAKGKANNTLIEKLDKQIGQQNILWEAPLKGQQVWFIKNFGAEVNLGNINPAEIIALETLRLGLRGDTFFQFLPKELQQK